MLPSSASVVLAIPFFGLPLGLFPDTVLVSLSSVLFNVESDFDFLGFSIGGVSFDDFSDTDNVVIVFNFF